MKSLRFVFLFAALTTAMVLPKSIQAGPLSFAKAVPYDSGGLAADSVAVADLNGDGHPDLVVANCQTLFNQSICDDSFTSGSVSVLLGNGDGTFQAAVSYSLGGNGATSVAVADLNGDGHPDLVVATWCQNSPPQLRQWRRERVAGQRRRYFPGPGKLQLRCSIRHFGRDS